MIDVSSEQLLTFAQAAKLIPSRPHVSTFHRWRTRGIRGVRLETILIGGERFTSREALQRFFDQSTAAADGLAPQARTPSQRQRDIERAEAELAKMGV